MKLRFGRILAAALAAGVPVAGCRLDYSSLFVSDGDFLATGRTSSFFRAVQIDPRSEDSAGPHFVVHGDLDNNGLTDLVTGWNESQPIQIHLQQRDEAGEIRFETTTVGGTIPIAAMADIQLADFDQDGWADIAVMIKIRDLTDVGVAGPKPFDGAVMVFFSPADEDDLQNPLAWSEVLLGQSELAGFADGDGTTPDLGGYTDMEIGDIDLDGDLDIVAAFNWAIEDDTSSTATAEEAAQGRGRVEVFFNPDANGVSRARRGGEWSRYKSPTTSLLSLEARQTTVKDVELVDIDCDNDLDVVVTRPAADSMNVRWIRNPVIRRQTEPAEWLSGVIGHIFTGADTVEAGDLDQDGIPDVVVRSTQGRVIQWFKGPKTPVIEPPRNLPWQVFTLAEFARRTPQAIALGDLNGDGQLELIVAAGGAVVWFDALSAPSVFDQWTENLIIDDSARGQDVAIPTTDPNAAPIEVSGGTFINSILVVDLDGDGAVDFVATLDRSGLSGLSNDALAWFENTLGPTANQPAG